MVERIWLAAEEPSAANQILLRHSGPILSIGVFMNSPFTAFVNCLQKLQFFVEPTKLRFLLYSLSGISLRSHCVRTGEMWISSPEQAYIPLQEHHIFLLYHKAKSVLFARKYLFNVFEYKFPHCLRFNEMNVLNYHLKTNLWTRKMLLNLVWLIWNKHYYSNISTDNWLDQDS